MKSRSLAAAVALALTSGTPAMATPDFVNGLTVPASTTDLSGDPNSINQRLGMFSDIYYDPNRNEWWALSDRGAGGGTRGRGRVGNCNNLIHSWIFPMEH